MSKLVKLTALCMSLVLSAACLSLAAAPDAASILKASLRAGNHISLRAQVKTTVYGQRGPASAIVRLNQSGPKSRMEYISGRSAGRTVIDDGKCMIRLDPAAKTAYITRTPPAPEQLDLMLSNYRPVMAGSERIAGRDCYRIKLVPACKMCASKQLWIDKQSLATLRIEKYNPEGPIHCATVYTSVDYSSRPSDALFRVPKGWKTVSIAEDAAAASLSSVRKAAGFTPRKPAFIPTGYVFDNYYIHNAPKGRVLAGMRYTNGLYTISLFEFKAGSVDFGAPECSMLLDYPQAHVIHSRIAGVDVVAVGNIADGELKKMVGSIK